MPNDVSRYPRYRFPAAIIGHAVWLYYRFTLSLRDVEDLLAHRGITVSYESIRNWCATFGLAYARRLRHRAGPVGDTWHLDELFVTIRGQRQYLWRAVDQDGEVIDILPRSPGSRAVLSQAAQAERPCTAPARHRSPRQLSCCAPGHHAVRRPRHDSLRQQPVRSLTPADAPTRAPHAPLQIRGTGPAVPRGSRRCPQPVHHWGTSASGAPSATAAFARPRYVERSDSGLTPCGTAASLNLRSARH
jgi:hypothetical protein